MKKLFFVIILLFFVSSTQAQLIRGYGIKLGITSANQNWDYVPATNFSFEPDNRVGVNFGVFAELLDIPFFSIATELNYVQKGMKEEIPVTTTSQPDGTGEFVTWDTRLDYINFSALGKFRLNLGVASPYLIAGPKIDFEINKSFSQGQPNVVENNFKKNRLGFKIGIGTEIDLLPIKLLAEFLYDADFNELYENEFLKVNSNSMDFRIGIMF